MCHQDLPSMPKTFPISDKYYLRPYLLLNFQRSPQRYLDPCCNAVSFESFEELTSSTFANISRSVNSVWANSRRELFPTQQLTLGVMLGLSHLVTVFSPTGPERQANLSAIARDWAWGKSFALLSVLLMKRRGLISVLRLVLFVQHFYLKSKLVISDCFKESSR